MLNVTLYVPAASPGTVCGAFHCCPVRPSISTVAPIGMDETINCPSLGAGGATGAADAFLAALPECDGALCALACSSCAASAFSTAWVALRPNGNPELAAGLDDDGAAASSSSAGWRWKSNAATTIRQSPPTTAATTFQWFAVLTGPRTDVFSPGPTYVVPTVPGVGALITWLADADGIALKLWLALGPGAALNAWLAFGPGMAFIDWLALGPGP